MLGGVRYGSLLQTGIAIGVLVLVTIVVMTLAGVRQRVDFLGAAVRAIVQLALVALVIAWIFAHPQGTAAYLAVMVVAATATSVRRIGCGWRRALLAAGPLVAGVVVAVAPVIAVGTLPLEGCW
jgi:putative ABC transport system permease protein